MYRIFVLLVMGADKGVVEGVQVLDFCHRYMPMDIWVYYMYACMLFSPDLDKHSQMYFPQHFCA